jgi:hypothetical protein
MSTDKHEKHSKTSNRICISNAPDEISIPLRIQSNSNQQEIVETLSAFGVFTRKKATKVNTKEHKKQFSIYLEKQLFESVVLHFKISNLVHKFRDFTDRRAGHLRTHHVAMVPLCCFRRFQFHLMSLRNIFYHQIRHNALIVFSDIFTRTNNPK